MRCACRARRRACCRPKPTAPTCAWSIRRWTRWRSRARIRTAKWCSSASASRPRCPRTALTVLQAEREGINNFSVFCNHITIVPTIKAILDTPDLHLDGFLGPGPRLDGDRHRALRLHRRALRQAAGGRRLRAARYPAVDLDGAQTDQGGSRGDREPVRPRRAATTATRAALAPSPGSTSCANSSSGAASARSTIRA